MKPCTPFPAWEIRTPARDCAGVEIRAVTVRALDHAAELAQCDCFFASSRYLVRLAVPFARLARERADALKKAAAVLEAQTPTPAPAGAEPLPARIGDAVQVGVPLGRFILPPEATPAA